MTTYTYTVFFIIVNLLPNTPLPPKIPTRLNIYHNRQASD